MRTGLDVLLGEPAVLDGRRYGVLAHGASLSAELMPIHLALAAAGAPAARVLLGPEHGFYGVEQDMVAAADQTDPWTGIRIVSLYGDSEASLRPRPEAFAGLDLLLVDLQDVGARYYTYAATAVWAAQVALAAGCEVWVLDRPNPLGGMLVEGALRRPGFESFVGAFALPVCHGLTLAELVRLEARRGGWEEGLRVWPLEGWGRELDFSALGRPWISPSPNIPSLDVARVYPGLCLVEGTELSEGRGTARPFELVGAPGVDPVRLAAALSRRGLAGVSFVPTYFRPQFQKHAGEVCAGVQIVVTDRRVFRPYRCGVELLYAVRHTAPETFAWRAAAYEFVADRPAIDLLAGGDELRRLLDRGADPSEWMDGWAADEAAFVEERRDVLLYPEAAA